MDITLLIQSLLVLVVFLAILIFFLLRVAKMKKMKRENAKKQSKKFCKVTVSGWSHGLAPEHAAPILLVSFWRPFGGAPAFLDHYPFCAAAVLNFFAKRMKQF